VQIIFAIFNLLLPRAQLRYSCNIYQLERSTQEVRIRAPRTVSVLMRCQCCGVLSLYSTF